LLRRVDPYVAWRAANKLGSAAQADLAAALADCAGDLARVSVVMPVYRPNREHFAAALASLRGQLHSDWQLCLCDDGSNDPSLTREMAELAADDPRIVVTALPANAGIAAATNAAAALATGDFLLFMDQDDRLTIDCLAEFVLAFTSQSDLDLAYSDSDKLDLDGTHHAPSFKPGWSPLLLLSYMYLGHAVAIRRELFKQLGGLRSEFNGSQDYDLVLRAAEAARAVRHIPRILYHWRVAPGSTALSASEKPPSILAGQRAVDEAAARRNIAAKVLRPDWAGQANLGLFELRFTAAPASLSVIITVADGAALDPQRLDALLEEVPATAQVILALPDRAPDVIPFWTSRRGRVLLLRAEKGQPLSERMAAASERADGTMLVFVSSDLSPTNSGWLAQLCGYASLPGIGLASARINGSDGKIRHVGLIRPAGGRLTEAAFAGLSAEQPGTLYLARTSHECAAVPTGCIALSRVMLKNAGGFAGGLDQHAAIGISLSEAVCARGYGIVVCASAELVGAEYGAFPPRKGAQDPWYNPNLGTGAAQFLPALRCPPLRRPGVVRLAVVTHNLDREGAQSVLLDLVAGLVAGGYVEAFVISPHDGILGEAFRAAGVQVKILPSPPRRAAGQSLADYRAALGRLFSEGGAEAVLVNTLECHAAVAAAAEVGLGAIWWQHEGGAWHRYFRHLRPAVRARAFAAFAQAYRVVQVAEATRRDWLPIATRDNFEVIRHSIPPKRIAADKARWSRREARRSLNLDENEICILLLGSVSRRKGQGDIISALRKAPQYEVERLRIVIAGAFVEPRYRERLEAMYSALPSAWRAKVAFVGEIDPAKYLAAADIFVCCSRQESSPRAIVEALVFSLPIITTPVDGIPELVISGVNGLFYSPGDHESLLKLVLQLSASPQERLRLGRAGLMLLPGISDHDAMLDRFASLVREAAWTGDQSAPKTN
jgi:glycosyltransferase involved in cell wall biosynthesis